VVKTFELQRHNFALPTGGCSVDKPSINPFFNIADSEGFCDTTVSMNMLAEILEMSWKKGLIEQVRGFVSREYLTGKEQVCNSDQSMGFSEVTAAKCTCCEV
jgi:hypothetical protein